MTNPDRMTAGIVLLRAAVWGQALGILAFAAFLAIEDAPDYFARSGLSAFILPLAAIVAIQMPTISRFIGRSISGGMLVLFILITSVSTAAGAVAYMIQAYSIPTFLVTEGWKYTRGTSLILAAIFVLALAVNIVLSVRLLRSSPD